MILGDSYRTLWGEDALTDTLCGLTFRLSVPSFYQVNPDQTEVLYGKAVELAGLTGRETVLDLYCGIGTISLAMARRARAVWGAEVVPEAVDDAVANAARNGVTNARFLCADAGQAARRLAAEGVRPDVVCVDPPRKGLAEDVVDTVADMAPGPGGLRLLRPGHPGPGREALCRPRLCPPRRPARGHVPPHPPCGDGGPACQGRERPGAMRPGSRRRAAMISGAKSRQGLPRKRGRPFFCRLMTGFSGTPRPTAPSRQ